jgi:uncharacterized membrane-anchored protein YitT (DUF2179 family)
MTPQEKAKELFMRNFEITVDDYCAKQCALIAVNEIINNYEEQYKYCKTKVYWQEVKQEIEKL